MVVFNGMLCFRFNVLIFFLLLSKKLINIVFFCGCLVDLLMESICVGLKNKLVFFVSGNIGYGLSINLVGLVRLLEYLVMVEFYI